MKFTKQMALFATLWSFISSNLLFAQAKDATPAKTDKPAISVTVQRYKPELISDAVVSGAYLQPSQSQQIMATQSGVISKVHVQNYQQVSKGKTIATVSFSDPAFLPLAIKAPFSGIVSLNDLQVGKQVNSSTVLATITSQDEFTLTIYLSARETKHLKSLSRVEMKLANTDEVQTDIQTTLKEVSPLVHSSTGTFPVTFSVTCKKANCNLLQYSGSYAKIRLVLNERKNRLIPSSAINLEKNTVFIVNEKNEIVEQAIVIGDSVKEKTEITSGLTDEMKIVNAYSRTPAVGETVTVVPSAEEKLSESQPTPAKKEKRS